MVYYINFCNSIKKVALQFFSLPQYHMPQPEMPNRRGPEVCSLQAAEEALCKIMQKVARDKQRPFL